MREKRHPLSVRKLFPLLFSGMIMVCIAVLIVLFSRYVSGQIQNNVQTDTERQMDALSAGLEQEIQSMSDLINQVYYQILKTGDGTQTARDASLQDFYRQHNNQLVNVALYLKSGETVWSTEQTPAPAADVVKQPWFQQAAQTIEQISFGSPQLVCREDQLTRVLVVSRYVEFTRGGQSTEGVLRLDFPVSDLDSTLERYKSTKVDYCYVLDTDGSMLYHPFRKEIASGLWEEWSMPMLADTTVQHNHAVWNIQTHQIGYTGWKLVAVRSLTDVQQQNHNLYVILWVVLCATGAVLILTDLLLLRLITHPVSQLSAVMERFGVGDLSVRAQAEGIGELRALADHFNSMAERIQGLMRQVIANEKEKRHMERKLLQSQITPHFLYNTLDSIIWMIQSGEYEGAGKMVSLLAKFFRVSLSQGKDIIPLRKEIEHAVSYLSIQNIRFKDKFEFTTDIDASLLDYLCPKITIQPIIENAVYHGMEGKYDDGEIELSVHEVDGNICIAVADNGGGMTEEQIDYILHNKVVSSKRSSGVGVHNVDDRLKLLYGPEYGVTIESVLDEGTTVRMTIPKVRETDEE